MSAKISIIVAHDDKLGIGKNNQLLFRISEDLKRFKKITTNHPIIMGRKTFESIGKPLPDRTNIVITRNPDFKADGCKVVDSLDKAISLARDIDDQEIFIIGGGQIYKLALDQNFVNRLYITHIQGDFKAEVFFPDYENFKITVARQEGQEGDYQFTYITLEK